MANEIAQPEKFFLKRFGMTEAAFEGILGAALERKADYADLTDEAEGMPDFTTQQELDDYINKLESDMREAAKKFEFEKAAKLRDTVKELRTKEFLFS